MRIGACQESKGRNVNPLVGALMSLDEPGEH